MENISKQIISFDDKQIFGYVLKPAVDYVTHKFIGYYVAEYENENVYLLKLENIISISDFIVVSSLASLDFVQDDGEDFKKQVLDEEGNDLGIIESFMIEKGKISKILTNKCEISTKYVISEGKDMLFVSFKKKRKSVREKTFPRSINEEIIVRTMVKEDKFPTKLTLSMQSFLGKIATKTLLGFNNEIIIKQGGKITKQVFEKAKKHNKLNQLYFISGYKN